jgi:hypothetical protein
MVLGRGQRAKLCVGREIKILLCISAITVVVQK